MPQTVLSGVLGRELLDGGRDTTRNPGNEARTKRKNDIKRRVGCSSKQGMAPDRLKLKTLNDNPYSTPGHSPGSACYIIDDKYIFTGDSLIQNTPTVLRFKTSNKDVFEQTTRPFLRSLDKNMLVFPGHGEPFKISESKYL